MNTEQIYDADPQALAAIMEAAFARLGELGRNGGEVVRERLTTTAIVDVEEGLAQLDELYAPAR
jgi:hypothetical protein